MHGMQLPSRTTDLMHRLTQLGLNPDFPSWMGVMRALGVMPGAVPTDETHPLLGFHAVADLETANLTCYLVMPTRFARYEWQPDASMLVTCSTQRIAQVTETFAGNQLTVKLALDSQGMVTTGESLTRQLEDGGGLGTRMEGKTEPISYTLASDLDDQLETAHLMEFSQALMIATGL